MTILQQRPVAGAFTLAIVCAATASGCGFRLEGSGTLPAAAATTYVDAENPHTDFYASLTEAFRIRGAEIVESPQAAGAVVRILEDTFGQRMLSVSARNIPREYEVFYTVTFSAEAGGETLIAAESLVATRSYTYDETLVLGKSAEEDVLRQSLARDLARQVLRLIATDRGRVAAVRN